MEENKGGNRNKNKKFKDFRICNEVDCRRRMRQNDKGGTGLARLTNLRASFAAASHINFNFMVPISFTKLVLCHHATMHF